MKARFYPALLSRSVCAALANLLLVGACAQVPDPTMIPQAFQPTPVPVASVATPSATPAAQPTVLASDNLPDPTPKVRTVWNTVIGSNKMDGTCAGTPILPAYGQVQLTPAGDVLEYKNQQTTYVFKRAKLGEWIFKGPSPLNDGTIDLVLTFKDEKNLSVVHKLVPGKDPACTHTFIYSGTFMWER